MNGNEQHVQRGPGNVEREGQGGEGGLAAERVSAPERRGLPAPRHPHWPSAPGADHQDPAVWPLL